MLQALNSFNSFLQRGFLRIKRNLIYKLGMVSDQYFYLDSYMTKNREDGIERLDVHSPQSEIEFIVPSNGKFIKSFLLERYLYRLDNPIIDPQSGFIYDRNGVFIAESSSWNLLRTFYSRPRPFISQSCKKLNGEYIFINDIGYGHWLLEDLPVFLGAYKSFPQAIILSPRYPSPWLQYVLKMLNNKIIYVDKLISVEKLIMAGKSAGYGHPAHGLTYNPYDVELLRDFFYKYLCSSQENDLLLFASRRGESRCPENIIEVEKFMVSKGYKILNSELNLSLGDQIKLFSGAKKVVGIHGAALMNLVWCHLGVSVTELFADEYMPTAFPAISSIRSLNYSMLNYGESFEDPIDLALLESFC